MLPGREADGSAAEWGEMVMLDDKENYRDTVTRNGGWEYGRSCSV